MVSPTKRLDETDLGLGDKVEVPVIRLFGSLPNGRKACMLVHRVYPYFYLPWHGTRIPPGDEAAVAGVAKEIEALRHDIDEAVHRQGDGWAVEGQGALAATWAAPPRSVGGDP